MKAKGSKAADFLRQMTPDAAEAVEIEQRRAPVSKRRSKGKAPSEAAAPATSRAGLKHFGAYLDDPTLEKIALLRVRLKLDNSELTKRAVDDLYAKHMARRAHGDG